jgi:Tfp pilus assembly protein PilF
MSPAFCFCIMATATRSKSRKRFQSRGSMDASKISASESNGAPPALAQSTAVPAKKSPWILGRWLDLLLFVGTPAVLIPIFIAAQARWSAQDIFLFVGAFGAMGHHLPGMIRAYGDKALFHRFRTRFVVAPLGLLAVCIWSAFYNVQAVQLVALAWGIWHGLMQTYGFSRIYDAKSSTGAAARARTDLALCVAWFVAAVLLSPLRFRSCLDLYYESGGPVIPTWVVSAIRTSVIAIVAIVTLNFIWRQWSDARAGRGFSPVKLLLLASSIGFWWYCNNGVQNILVGIALFEVFHDVQYLSIVWIYNRARVERDESIRGFMRFVFRRSGSLLGVYVGLVLAYGGIGLVSRGVSIEAIRNTLIGVVTASALLHFYYDGFIWKVRETQTRNMLGIEGSGMSGTRERRKLPLWTAHTLRWAALIIPVGALCAAQLMGRVVPPLERYGKVVELLPADAKAQLNYGKALHDVGRIEEAQAHYELALARDPSLAEAEFHSGLAWSDRGDFDRALGHYERALALEPTSVKAEVNLAGILRTKGSSAEARRHYEQALKRDNNLDIAHKELADLMVEAGEYDAAIPHYLEALRINPDFRPAKENLSFARSLATH